jgi:hypothetical protein
METPKLGDWEQSIETLKEKWTEFTNGMFLAIRKEEARIRRDE